MKVRKIIIMNKIRNLLILSFFLLPSLWSSAQEGLNIEKIFNDYGKQQGSILIELAKDVLGDHTKIEKYKSLIITSSPSITDATLEAIKKDLDRNIPSGNAFTLMESKKDGSIESASYTLGNVHHSNLYDYILFNNKNNKLTVIYIRGKFPPEDLEDELLTLKNLFIHVNTKNNK